MNQIAMIRTDILTMSSREIAELVDSRHDDVKRSIARLADRGTIQLPPLAEVKNHLGQTVTEYQIGKRDSYIIVAQLSPEFTARLVDRWQELESRQQAPAELSRMDILKLAMQSEEARIQAEAERDHAIATKAQIGSRREATAMATAAKAKRESNSLKARLGEAAKSASVMAVEGKTKRKFEWRPLRDYCNALELEIGKSFNPGIQREVNTYPAQAWMDVYGVDLVELFGEEVVA